MARKTFSVETFKNNVNKFLESDRDSFTNARMALMVQLESILHETGNYNGFKYLTSKQLPENSTPGINTNPDGSFIRDEDCYDVISARFNGTDKTRVRYF